MLTPILQVEILSTRLNRREVEPVRRPSGRKGLGELADRAQERLLVAQFAIGFLGDVPPTCAPPLGGQGPVRSGR